MIQFPSIQIYKQSNPAAEGLIIIPEDASLLYCECEN